MKNIHSRVFVNTSVLIWEGSKKSIQGSQGGLPDQDGDDVPVYFKLYSYNRLRRSLPRLLRPQDRVVNTVMCSGKTLDDNADAHMVSILLS